VDAKAAPEKSTRAVKKTPPGKPGVKLIKKQKAVSRSTEMVESDIAAVEQDLNRISELMGTPEVVRDATRLIALNEEYQQAETRLRDLYSEWDRVSEALAKTSS